MFEPVGKWHRECQDDWQGDGLACRSRLKASGWLRRVLVLVAVLIPTGALAEQAPVASDTDGAAEIELDVDRDPLSRDTPRGTVEGFLKSIDENEPTRAAEYLDLRNLPSRITEYTPEQLAAGLSIVLERGVWFDLEQLSQSEEGHSGDGLPSYRDLLVELPTPEKTIRVLLQRVPDGKGGRVWKFSNATLAELDVLYESYRYNAFVEWLAQKLPDVSFLTIELFKWVATLLAVLVAAPFVLLFGWLAARALVAEDRPLHANVRRFLMGPVSSVVLILIADRVLHNLGIGLTAQKITSSYTLITAVTIWLLWQAVNLFREGYGQRLASLGRGSSIALLRPLANAMKLIFLLLGVLVWLDNLGFQITAVLTGLGIGGVAVALVLQKPLEDVFGAITLYTQQPIKIGDFGRFGMVTGTVEEISLRTTRIRTLANTLVSIPNMRMAGEPIENLSAREKFLYSPVLRLQGDASGSDLSALLEQIREALQSHEKVRPESQRVRFTAITLAGFDVSVFAYIDAQDWADYLAVAEALNLTVLELISASPLSLSSQGAVLSTSLE